MYSISVDHDKNLIRVSAEGFWSQSDFFNFLEDLNGSYPKLKCRIGRHILLCDLTKLNVVAQQLADSIVNELNSQGPNDAEWIAIVCNTALLKLQFQRFLTRPRAKIFEDAASAGEWLLDNSGYRRL
jgi:hypothetical protein